LVKLIIGMPTIENLKSLLCDDNSSGLSIFKNTTYDSEGPLANYKLNLTTKKIFE
jgi:hypothetical protein